MAKFVQNVLSITTSDLPSPTIPSTLLTSPTNNLLQLQPTNISSFLQFPPEREIQITASALAVLILFLLILAVLLLWMLVLTLDFSVRYMTGNLGERKRRRCGGGHEEEGLCKVERHAHFGRFVLGEKVGGGIASALDWEGVEFVGGPGMGVGVGDGGARRRSAE